MKKIAALIAGVAFALTGAWGQVFPTKPVTIVVPAPPGGTADTVMRKLSAKLAAGLAQPVVIQNRPGAGGVIASQFVAQAQPDGYTLLMNYTSHAINPALMEKLPYDTLKAFVPVAFLGKVPLLLAVPASSPVNTAAEWIADARRHPGQRSYGSSAIGGASHLGAELFSQLTAGKLLAVNYKGGAAAAMDLAMGHISMLLDSALVLEPLRQDGRIKVLGVASEQPSAVFPQLEPIGKRLPGFEATAWYGVMAPAGTPPQIVERLHSAINGALSDPELKQQMVESGFEMQTMSANAWRSFLARETERWGGLIQASGIPKI